MNKIYKTGEPKKEVCGRCPAYDMMKEIEIVEENARMGTKGLQDSLIAYNKMQLERDAWMETARLEGINKEFYRDVITEIGEMFGIAAKTSDDGTVQDHVLALKVPELVQKLIGNKNE